jgi:hypothetical protein
LNHLVQKIVRHPQPVADTAPERHQPQALTRPIPQSGSKTKNPIPLMLHVLNGTQQGAQGRMRHHRMLVGNSPECDVVLDLGTVPPHACLVHASKEGWRVLSLAGDLWVGSQWVPLHKNQTLAYGDVLTLGEVSFCIAPIDSPDANKAAIPTQREPSKNKPSAKTKNTPKNNPTAAHIRTQLKALTQKISWPQSLTAKPKHLFIALLFTTVLVLTGALLYLFTPAATSPTAQSASPQAAEVARAALANVPWAREIKVQPDPQNPQRVLLTGYLPHTEDAAALQAVLAQIGIQAQMRHTLVSDLTLDLTRRLSLLDSPAAQPLRYTDQGHFTVVTNANRIDFLDRQIRRAMQDLPPLKSLTLRITDRFTQQAADKTPLPITIKYTRSEGVSGGIHVTGLEALQPTQKTQRIDVQEIRSGQLPSVVLDNGTRYFKGSSLPGGSVLIDIQPTHLIVESSTQERSRIELGQSANP